MQSRKPDCVGLTQQLMESRQAVLFFLAQRVAES